MAFQGAGCSKQRDAKPHAKGFHQVPPIGPVIAFSYLTMWRGHVSSDRRPIHYAARSRAHSRVSRQTRLQWSDPAQNRGGCKFGPASTGGERGSAAFGQSGCGLRQAFSVPVVHEPFGAVPSDGGHQGQPLGHRVPERRRGTYPACQHFTVHGGRASLAARRLV